MRASCDEFASVQRWHLTHRRGFVFSIHTFKILRLIALLGISVVLVQLAFDLDCSNSPIPVVNALQPPSIENFSKARTDNDIKSVPDTRTALPVPSIPKAIIVSTKKNGGHTLRYDIRLNQERSKTTSTQETNVPSVSSHAIAATDVTTVDSASTKSTLLKQLSARYFRHIQQFWKTAIVSYLRVLFHKEYWQSVYDRIRSGLRSTFLPIGYPNTVPDHYASYVVWSSLQDLCTSVRSVIATQRVLQGIGVGTNTATTLSAIQNFLLRDAAGMFASLSFTALTSGIFSKDVKRWRLFADCVVDIGITLEVMAVQLPKPYFVPMLCIANMCKAMCGVAAGATSGSIALYWSSKANSDGGSSGSSGSSSGSSSSNSKANRQSNDSTDISDINAKFGAQNTVTGSFGLIFSAIFARSVATAPLSFVWVIYSILTAFHIYANMQCMRIIAFPQFNTVRFNHVVASFFNQWFTQATTSISTDVLPTSPNDVDVLQLPTPSQIAKVEPLFFTNASSLQRRSIPILFGLSFNEYNERSGSTLDVDTVKNILLNKSKTYPYFISMGSTKQFAAISPSNCCINIALPSNTSAYTQAQAYFHATLYRRIIHDVTTTMKQDNSQIMTDFKDVLQIVEGRVRETFPLAWERFVIECTKSGWELSRTELHGKGYEIAFQES
jgi:Vitamin B6 photo-protection and homoeostasis